MFVKLSLTAGTDWFPTSNVLLARAARTQPLIGDGASGGKLLDSRVEDFGVLTWLSLNPLKRVRRGNPVVSVQ